MKESNRSTSAPKPTAPSAAPTTERRPFVPPKLRRETNLVGGTAEQTLFTAS